MNFKDFYLLQERHHFSDLLPKTDEILAEIKNKIKGMDDFKSGDTINVQLEDGIEVPIVFYKNKSKTYLTHHAKDKKKEDVYANYFNGKIEVYLSRLFPDREYGKINPFKLVKAMFPVELQSALRHELTHAYEDLVQKVLRYNIDKDQSPSAYINSTAELNAHLVQWLGQAYNHNRIFRSLVDRKELFDAVLFAVRNVIDPRWKESITPENKKWLYKTIYQIISDLID